MTITNPLHTFTFNNGTLTIDGREAQISNAAEFWAQALQWCEEDANWSFHG